MKLRPRFLLLLLLTTLLTIGIPSCGGEDFAAIRDIKQIFIFDPGSNQVLTSPASTSGDTIVFIVMNEIDFFSDNTLSHGTMAEAWAFRPATPWMANEIADIRVFCDQPVFGHPAHQNLSSQLKFGNSLNFQLSLDMFIESLPDIGDDYTGFSIEEFQVFLNTKPSTGTYTFTIEIEDNNGHVFTANTIPIQWL